MSEELLKVVHESNESIQQRNLPGIAWFYFYSGSAVGAVLFIVLNRFFPSSFYSCLAFLSVPLSLAAAVLAGKRRRKKVSEWIAEMTAAIDRDDSGSFVKELTRTKGGRSWKRYALPKLYSHLIPIAARDWVLSDHEKMIAESLQSEILRLDPKSQSVSSIQLFYLDQILGVYDTARFVAGPEGYRPYPEKEEAFLRSFIEFFRIPATAGKRYSVSVEKQIVQRALTFIEEGNTEALEKFLEAREGVWKNFPELLREIYLSLLAATIAAVGGDFESDSGERRAIDVVLKRLTRYAPDTAFVEKITMDFLKSAADADPAGLSGFVRALGLENEEPDAKAAKIFRILEIKRISQGELPLVSSPVPGIPAGSPCHFRSPVVIYKLAQDNDAGLRIPARGLNLRPRQKGVLVLTDKSIVIFLKQMHVVRFDDIVSVRRFVSVDVVEIRLSGEMGELFVSSEDNEMMIAILGKLIPGTALRGDSKN